MADAKPLSGVRVMVIDDSNTIRRSAEIFLMQAGCQVILAENGFDALAKIADHQPDLIFVDIMMPRLDGYQVLEAMKADPALSDLPVIVVSAVVNCLSLPLTQMACSAALRPPGRLMPALDQALPFHWKIRGPPVVGVASNATLHRLSRGPERPRKRR